MIEVRAVFIVLISNDSRLDVNEAVFDLVQEDILEMDG